VTHKRSVRGWLLVGFIIVLTFVFVVLAGVVFFLSEHRKILSHHLNQARAVYLAQAGIMHALYEFRRNEGIERKAYSLANPAGPAPGASEDAFTIGGKDGDFLLANMIPAAILRIAVIRTDLLHSWTLRNALRNDQITITHMRVSWNPVPKGQGVRRILLGNTKVYPCGGGFWSSNPAQSGQLIDLGVCKFDIDPNTEVGDNIVFIRSQNGMGNASIDVEFRLSDHVASANPLDASLSVGHYFPPGGATRSADIVLKSVGEVRSRSFPFVTWRRLRAQYRMFGVGLTDPGSVIGYTELEAKTP
jgi:hypothetical protein